MVTYIEYVAGNKKGETENGDLFNNPFKLGDVDANYTSERVVEIAGNPDAEGFVELAWTPVVKAEAFNGTNWVECTVVDGKKINVAKGTKVRYIYDNIMIPQNDLPTLRAEMKSIPLIAKARRIAIVYSQMAAFQAQTDYGVPLGDQLAEKAVGQLEYEIDTEVTNLLIETAGEPDAELVWSKTLPVGVSKRDHYMGFAELMSIAAQKIYDRTKRFMPTYMLCSSSVVPVLNLMDGFDAAPTTNINGPYFAGTLNGLKVFVTPNIEAGKFCLGVNGNDMMSSVAVYAPYMPVVPTMLLQTADGASSQGFSTLYDLKVLNKDLIVAGKVVA